MMPSSNTKSLMIIGTVATVVFTGFLCRFDCGICVEGASLGGLIGAICLGGTAGCWLRRSGKSR
eukprot:jgi/Botrbrau1/15335/Bobra.0147s0001.1